MSLRPKIKADWIDLATQGGDYVFIRDTCDHYPGGPVWRQEVIAIARPDAATGA
jgi:hypothetical protein